MRFTEINVLGVYVAPISLIAVTAWLVLAMLRKAAGRFGILANVWHPALFLSSLYLIVLSTLVLSFLA